MFLLRASSLVLAGSCTSGVYIQGLNKLRAHKFLLAS